jgi:glycine/D-amino acid oxidase-like deaminating enzyme
MGLSTAWALVRRGVDVTLLEQGPLPNPQASSMGEHRLIRTPYGSQEGYARLIDAAFEAWDRLWEDLGTNLYRRTGTLAFGSGSETGWTERSRSMMERLGIPLEILDRTELEARFGFLDFHSVQWGFWMAGGGALRCGLICEAIASWLAAGRAETQANTPVRSVDFHRGSVLTEAGDELTADAVVVAAGPWTSRLVGDLEARITPSRQILAFARPPAHFAEAWARAPMVIDVGAAGFYAVPPVDGTRLKIGDHTFSREGDPDGDREAGEAEARAVFECARTRFVDFDQYELIGRKACFYTVEPDERFVVEPRGRGWVLAGFSGHGFKFGPWVGASVAEAILGEREAAEVTRVAAGR